jgi:hypothetical protein
MTARKVGEGRPRDEKSAPETTSPPTGADSYAPVKALPKPTGPSRSDWIDVTGIMPQDIRIDPNITEGHPGYEESGESEIIPNERFGGGETTKSDDTRG